MTWLIAWFRSLLALLGWGSVTDETPKAGGGAGEKPALPVVLPKAPPTPAPAPTVAAPLTLSRFGPAAIDYQINHHLEQTIPNAAGAIFDIKLKSSDGGEDKMLSGIVAVKGKGGWGAALGGAIDLNDKRNYEVELVGIKSF